MRTLRFQRSPLAYKDSVQLAAAEPIPRGLLQGPCLTLQKTAIIRGTGTDLQLTGHVSR